MLILVPSPLSQATPSLPLLAADLPTVQTCTSWIVENAKPARAALKWFGMQTPIRELQIFEINRMDEGEINSLLRESSRDNPVALMSDAGCPGIADPGAKVVEMAHRLKVKVLPLVGPSSIFLGLMASGFSGQRFEFIGYLPVKPIERKVAIEQSMKRARESGVTQIAIETPFRNQALFDSLTKDLPTTAELCVCIDLTGESMQIHRKSIQDWRKTKVNLEKLPTLFIWAAV